MVKKKTPVIKILILLVLILLVVLDLTWHGLPTLTKSVSSVTSSNLTGVPICTDHNPDSWHPPAKKDSQGKIICIYGHEHGDPPPDWVSQAGFEVGFDQMAGFMANTSEIENTQKHSAMKGFAATIEGVQVYLRLHLASTPLDRTARYHSYELFLKDQSGGISHFQGWVNTGDPISDRIPYHDSTFGQAGQDPGRRPIVWAATRHACLVDKTWCIELWKMTTTDWGPTIVWGINDPVTYFHPGEKYDPDISHWDLTGNLGVERTLTLSIQRNSSYPVGKFWATQFGDLVSGPNDPICSQMSQKYGVDYQNVCLEEQVAPTLPEIGGVENGVHKTFDATGVVPN